MIDDQVREILRRPNGPKFFLWGATIRSQYDGQRHYIAAQKLVYLYGLPEGCCVFEKKTDGDTYAMRGRISLGPRPAGDYREHLVEMLKTKWCPLP